MKIKTKLRYGISILFAMIVLLGVLSLGYINKLNKETQKIYTNNNYSLNYCRNMLSVLDDVPTSKSARQIFISNLQKQQRNLTEVNEKETTEKLTIHFEELKNKNDEQSLKKIRSDIYTIMNLNMASIYHKSEVAKQTASDALLWIFMTFATCVIFAFGILFRSPRSILKPIKELTDGIMEIANHNYDKRLNFEPTNEFGEVSASFNKMAERLNEYRISALSDIIANKKYIESIVNSITEPIIGLNDEMEILFINNEALNILNLKRENVIKKSAPELALKNDLLRKLISELVNPKERNEPLKIYADNKENYFQANYIPIKVIETGETEPHNIGNVILMKNITEFEELDTAKAAYLSSVFHELKAPVSAILSSLKSLEDNKTGKLNEEQKSLLQNIKENSDSIVSITGEFLKFTQAETGRLQLNPKITKPIELIEYALKATHMQAERYGCHIEVEYPEKISKLFVDSEKIAWVLTNLLNNAIHYSKENSRIIIGAKQEGDVVEMFVRDFGKGIDPRYHQSIFDRYFRVPGVKVQGSGLGLSISKDFVEAHEGTLTIESELGKGSKFIIRLKVR